MSRKNPFVTAEDLKSQDEIQKEMRKWRQLQESCIQVLKDTESRIGVFFKLIDFINQKKKKESSRPETQRVSFR